MIILYSLSLLISLSVMSVMWADMAQSSFFSNLAGDTLQIHMHWEAILI